MRQSEFDFNEGMRLRDQAIQVAADNADWYFERWSERAFELFEKWLSGWPAGYTFLIEDFRQSARIHGLPVPPSKRAFGAVAIRARNKGLIKCIGTGKVKNKNAHCANANLWEKI